MLPNGIPDKGRVLTQTSQFWFEHLDVPHHVISLDLNDVPLPDDVPRAPLNGRSMIVKNTQVVPIECVVRGFLAGSAWKEYQQSQSVCGISLPANLRECDRLPSPIFTPATEG